MKVLIVDPHTIYRRGLVAFVESMPEVERVAHLARPADVTDADLVIVDPAADPSGDFIRAAALSGARVVACSSKRSPEAVSAATQAGASAYLTKDTLTGDRLAAAVRAAASRIAARQS
jgi:DNA-binding NarL/FixJ family response regulator